MAANGTDTAPLLRFTFSATAGDIKGKAFVANYISWGKANVGVNRVGAVVKGRFVARDVHFGHYALTTLPASMLPNAPVPSTGNTQTAPFPGNEWSLDTGDVAPDMAPCGYVVLLQAWDRTIVNSHPDLHNYNQDDVGFCLRAANK